MENAQHPSVPKLTKPAFGTFGTLGIRTFPIISVPNETDGNATRSPSPNRGDATRAKLRIELSGVEIEGAARTSHSTRPFDKPTKIRTVNPSVNSYRICSDSVAHLTVNSRHSLFDLANC